MIRSFVVMVSLLVFPLAICSDETKQVDAVYHMDIGIADTQYPHVNWAGKGPIRYQWHHGQGSVWGSDIPQMTQYCPVSIPGYKAILLTIRGKAKSVGVIKIVGKDIEVSDLDLELEIDEAIPVAGVPVPPPKNVHPLLILDFPDIHMTTGSIAVPGKVLTGAIHMETQSADLVFVTRIPKTGNPELDTAIAGKTVLGRMTVQITRGYGD